MTNLKLDMYTKLIFDHVGSNLFHFLSWLTLVPSLCFTRYMHEVVIFFLEINAYDNLQVEFVVFDTNMP
jgi:hypothetical protein